MQNNQYIEEDEIDLKELFMTIWKYKVFILLFSFVVVLGALFFAIKKPNIYESKAIFMQTNDGKSSNSIIPEDLSGFVTFSVGQSGGAYETYEQLKMSYDFMKKFILKYKLYQGFYVSDSYVYPLGLNFSSDEVDEFGDIRGELTSKQESIVFDIFKTISSNLTISKDKKNALVTFSYKSPNRFLNKIIVDDFLHYTGSYLKEREIKSIEDQINNLNEEILALRNIDLKNKMLELISNIYKRKVFLQAEDYSGLQVVVAAEVPYIKDKSGPKRALIIVVSAVTSFILAIFFVFFLEFIKGSKSIDKKEEEIVPLTK